jgi:hypothetical protein
LSVSGQVRGGKAQRLRYVACRFERKEMFEFGVGNTNAFLQLNAIRSLKKRLGNLDRNKECDLSSCRNRKLEDPATIICGPEACISKIGLFVHEYS